MKLILFILFFQLLSFSNCSAQKTESYSFTGILKSSNNDIISYKISFRSSENGTIEGESFTDYNGQNSTKSKIKGTLNQIENKLSFHEISNISTKSNADVNQFCYIHVENLKINETNGQNIIQGKFKGFYSSGKKCVDGFIYLAGSDLIDQVEKYKDLDSTKLKDSLNTLLERQSYSSAKSARVASNETLDVKWNSNKIVLELWDEFSIDHDIITVLYGEKKILENYEISKEKKIIEIPFTEATGKITIKAVNEGISPPNTVCIMLKDGKKLTRLISILQKGEVAFISFDKIK